MKSGCAIGIFGDVMGDAPSKDDGDAHAGEEDSIPAFIVTVCVDD